MGRGKQRKGPGGIAWGLMMAAAVTAAAVLLTVTVRGMGV